MLSVWIDFRLDVRSLKMRLFSEWSMSKQQQEQLFKLVNLVFFAGAWC